MWCEWGCFVAAQRLANARAARVDALTRYLDFKSSWTGEGKAMGGGGGKGVESCEEEVGSLRVRVCSAHGFCFCQFSSWLHVFYFDRYSPAGHTHTHTHTHMHTYTHTFSHSSIEPDMHAVANSNSPHYHLGARSGAPTCMLCYASVHQLRSV